jgi:peptide-methionine (S)-S-oxide reductase
VSLTPTLVEAHDDDALPPAKTETATFGLGCFWGPDAWFGAQDGVVRTRVGYAGGTRPDPTYHALGDHTEVVQVDYDPDRLSYKDLLAWVFDRHDPHTQTATTQYQNVVLAASEAQHDALVTYLESAGFAPQTVETRLERLPEFCPAEDYHQKYTLRGTATLFEPLKTAGYDDVAVRESPAAAALNGVAAGHDLAPDHPLRVALDRAPGEA